MLTNEGAPSSVAIAVGGWLAIIGTATALASQHLYAENGPFPLVGGIGRFIYPAEAISAVKLAGYLAVAVGASLIAIVALCRVSRAQAADR